VSDGLKLLSRYINRVLAHQTRPLFLELDDALQLRTSQGDGRRYGFRELKPGTPLDEALAMLATADPEDRTPQVWRFVELPGSCICHVHVLRLSQGWGVAMLDASAEHAEQQTRQQAAHELELLREERERLIAELEQANRLKSEFIARMSHEFRTPLTSVIGYSEQLREIRTGDQEAQRYLDAVGRGGRYLLNLVENLLDQARIEVDELTLNPGGCDLHEMSDEIELLLRPLAIQKQLSFAWWFDAEIPPRLWLDATRLKQVLINLVGNAIKFTRQGGVNVEFGWKEDWLQVSITDTGPGMKDAEAAVVFEPFRQGGDGKRGKGAGLGLAISQTLVRAMGGEIRLTTEKGEGSCFEFRIKAAAVQGSRPGSTEALRDKRIVLADDDTDLLELLRLYLSSAGIETEACQSSEETLSAVRKTTPDAVILDLDLGSDDGARLAARLREAGYQGPVILLTAAATRDGGAADETSTFAARWTKPISRARLIEGLAGLIG